MTILAIAVSLAGLLFVVVGPRDFAIHRAIAFSIVTVSLVPLYAAPTSTVTVVFGLGIAAFVVAGYMSREQVSITASSLALLCFLTVEAVARVRGGSLELAGYNLVLVIHLALAAILLPAVVRRSGWGALTRTLAWLSPLHVMLALLEQFRIVQTIWPRGTYIDDIDSRPHQIFGALAGRSMSTLGHPITLSFIAGATIVACAYMIREGRRAYLVPLLLSAGTLMLSGSRSAVFATVAILAYTVLAERNVVIRAVAVIVTAGAGFALLQGDLLSDSLSGVSGETSFTHRFGVLSGLVDYLGQVSAEDVLLGRGIYGYDEFFVNGTFGDSAALGFFDNQLVRTFVTTGLLGLALLLTSMLVGWVLGDRFNRAWILFSGIMFFSFDLLTWQSSALIFALACAPHAIRAETGPLPAGRRFSWSREMQRERG